MPSRHGNMPAFVIDPKFLAKVDEILQDFDETTRIQMQHHCQGPVAAYYAAKRAKAAPPLVSRDSALMHLADLAGELRSKLNNAGGNAHLLDQEYQSKRLLQAFDSGATPAELVSMEEQMRSPRLELQEKLFDFERLCEQLKNQAEVAEFREEKGYEVSLLPRQALARSLAYQFVVVLETKPQNPDPDTKEPSTYLKLLGLLLEYCTGRWQSPYALKKVAAEGIKRAFKPELP